MKRIFSLLLIFSFVFVACNSDDLNGKDTNPQVRKDSLATSLDSLRVTGTTASGDSINEHDFLIEATSGGMMEVELGKIAQQNAKAASVKFFGNMMVTDHSKANEELQPIARAANIETGIQMMSKHQMHVDEMKKLKGAAFDKAYMSMMVQDHNEDMDHFKTTAQTARDTDIRNFASKTLPVLQMHLDSAKAINGRLR
ncbi:DUF4142 domain-containing protein [soil metagenome]